MQFRNYINRTDESIIDRIVPRKESAEAGIEFAKLYKAKQTKEYNVFSVESKSGKPIMVKVFGYEKI